jgi:uncharacterized protein YukE
MVGTSTGKIVVSNEELDAIAVTLKTHAADLGTVHAPLNALPGSSVDELGEQAHDAYRLFHDAWKRETDVLAEAMRECGSKFAETAKLYREIDAAHADFFTKILSGGFFR